MNRVSPLPRRLWSARSKAAFCLAAIATFALALAVSLTVVVSTSAAQTDRANVNLSNIAIPTFAVGVVVDGVVAEASADAPQALLFRNGSQLIPGGTTSAKLTIFNNSERVSSTVSVRVATVGDGTVTIDGVTRPNITRFLRITITDTDGTVLLDKAPVEDSTLTLPTLTPRERAELETGDPFIAGADGSDATVNIRIDYLDDPATRDYVTGLSALTLIVEATSG